MNRDFFVTWLKLGCLVTSCTGLLAFASSIGADHGLWLWLLDLLTWPLNGVPVNFNQEALLLNAILGGVMAGWGTLMYFIAADPIAQGNMLLARQMLLSILIWFCVDSIGSYVVQIPGNIVLNILFLFMLSIPLLVLSKESKPNTQALNE